VVGIGGCFLFPNHPPVASFTVSRGTNPDNPDDQLVVVLDASGSTDPDGDEITSYMWVFDENDVTFIAPLASSKTVTDPILTVKYPVQVSSSEVELAVVDSRGGTSVPVSMTITVPVPE
ncbi:MAG: hypothetical protein U9Q94_06235, partial [Candidatus Bipolaricaulota bacterium]|nr:hypothetical protein [Candidatus Bipolaricaulota bacterium]